MTITKVGEDGSVAISLESGTTHIDGTPITEVQGLFKNLVTLHRTTLMEEMQKSSVVEQLVTVVIRLLLKSQSVTLQHTHRQVVLVVLLLFYKG